MTTYEPELAAVKRYLEANAHPRSPAVFPGLYNCWPSKECADWCIDKLKAEGWQPTLQQLVDDGGDFRGAYMAWYPPGTPRSMQGFVPPLIVEEAIDKGWPFEIEVGQS